MAISKAKRASLYQSYMEALGKAQGMVITEYRGMNMKGLSAVRAALRPVDSTYTVVKTTIFKIALRENGFPTPEELLTGPIAVAIAYSDLPKVTKTLLAQVKDQPLLVPKGAIMGELIFDAERLETLSKMPTFEEARATLIGTIQAPARRLVSLFSQPATGLARVLKAYTDKQQESGGEAVA